MAFRGPGSVLHRPAYAVIGSDPAGTGDAFTAGLLGALHQLWPPGASIGDVAARDLADVLDTACAAAAAASERTRSGAPGRSGAEPTAAVI